MLATIFKSLLILVSVSLINQVIAWPSPVNMTEDLGDNSTDFNKYVVDADTAYDRCDTSIADYGLVTVPSICHRWNLVYELEGTPTDWASTLSVETHRLPTIKELVRLYNYTEKSLDPLIKRMIDVDDNPSADDWLISSSYRDIDGYYGKRDDDDTGRLQIFALNAVTGEVKTFEPGEKSDDPNRLLLCVSLGENGDCTFDSTDRDIYALKVNRTRLNELP